MNIGVIGSGRIGGRLGVLWGRAGHTVLFSSRHPERLTSLAAEAGHGARSGTVAEAAAFGDVILFAPNFNTADEALDAAGPLDGKVVIDATNPYQLGGGGIVRALPGTATAAAELRRKRPGAKVVKAYCTVPARYLEGDDERRQGLAVYYCGDDAAAKAVAARLIADSGFVGLDIGPLDRATEIEIPGRLQQVGMIPVADAQRLLAEHS